LGKFKREKENSGLKVEMVSLKRKPIKKKNAEIKMCERCLCVRETEASRYLVPWYWNIQMCGVVYVCVRQKLPDIWYYGTGIYKCVEWFMCARNRSFPISGTVVLEYTNVWSGLCVRETEASRYLVLWYWNIQMCGVVYVCGRQKLPNIWYCGTGI